MNGSISIHRLNARPSMLRCFTLAISMLTIVTACAGTHARAQTCVAHIQPSTPTINFVVYGDGTVTDRKTGLMWDQCTWGKSGVTCAQGASTTIIWPAALGVVATANGAGYKGYSDWRLPNIKELQSIVETCRFNPSINDEIFPITVASYFWSGSPVAIGSSYPWNVDFYGGSSYTSSGLGYVRLVRG